MLAHDAAKLALPETYANPEEVHAILSRVRKEEPVIWIEPQGVRPLWLVTKAKDLKFVETHRDGFITEPRATILPSVQEAKNTEAFGSVNGPLESLVNTDGNRHMQLRMLSQSWFMPAQIRKKQGEIEEIAEQFVQKLADKQPHCDFAADIGFWYPLRVINAIMGLPQEFDEPFLRLTQKMMASGDNELNDSGDDFSAGILDAVTGFTEIFTPLIEDRRKNPRNDLTSVLVNAEIDGQPISEMEIMGYLVVAATAGHDTTSATTAGGLLALIQNPDQLRKLKANPGLLPTAVEEFIRWVSPVKHFVRTATRDIEVGGKTIKKDESLAVMFSSTCRDESLFEDPFAFKVDRSPNNHLAFGTGPHLCLGMHLARIEVTAFFRALLPRLEDIELAGDPTYIQSHFITGLKSLPVRFKMK